MTNISALGYLGIGARDLAAWRTFAAQILGMQVVDEIGLPGNDLYLRSDDRQFRVVVVPGEDQLEFIGWEIATPHQFDELMRDLDAARVPYKEDPDLAALRGVSRLVTCTDPAGRTLEFYRGATVPRDPFVSPVGARFVTQDPGGADLGLGHVVLTFPDLNEALDFYLGTLRFKMTDTFTVRPGHVMTFTHVNPRHHSLGLTQCPPDTAPALAHLMLEVADIDMVGRALDRVHQHGTSKMRRKLGRHSNDRMLSFYVKSPSGFGVEYGCQGRLINDATWTSMNYTEEVWGHELEEGEV